MREKSENFTRKKALLIVFICAAALLLLIALRWLGASKEPDAATRTGRVEFLTELGWEVDPESEEYHSVLIPACDEGVMAEYNRMQLAQGYDLSRHCGEECEQYSYVVTNYPNYNQTVIVTLYVRGRQVIAGDIHSAALNGFMHGLRANT